MLKSDRKLATMLPVVLLYVLVGYMFNDFPTPMKIFMVIALVFNTVFALLLFIKRKDAIVIENGTITVHNAFVTKEFIISKYKSIKIIKADQKAIYGYYLEEGITKKEKLLGNFYNDKIDEIYNFLLDNYPNLEANSGAIEKVKKEGPELQVYIARWVMAGILFIFLITIISILLKS